MDVATLRTEIKSWERAFKSQNAREPSVQDIKSNPSVAEKYKLYKKLVKSAVNPAPLVEPQPVSTASNAVPPRQKIILIPKELPVPSPAQPSVVNPFSPSRKTEKDKMTSRIIQGSASIMANPFTTPRTRRDTKLVHEPNSTQPPTEPYKSADSSPYQATPQLGLGTIARARKRLRGEPVSPSPQKRMTRRRVGLQAGDVSSDSECSNGSERCFVDDSPVKPIANGKHFKSLFNETSGVLSSKPLFNVSTISLDHLFLSPSMSSGPSWKPSAKTSYPPLSDSLVDGVPSSRIDDRIAFTERGPQDTSDRGLSMPLGGSGEENLVGTQKKLKRPVSPDLNEWKSHHKGLLPPSPSQSAPKSAVAKGKAPERKKLRLGAEQTSRMDSSEDTDEDVREVSWNFHTGTKISRWKGTAYASEAESYDRRGPTIDNNYFLEPNNRLLSNDTVQLVDSSTEVESLEVDLPHHLKSVLAISPSKKYHPEDALVRSLLYGDHVQGYGGPQGGEVWGVGEVENTHTDSEDDWAGEGIPWEAGEL